MTLRPGRPKTWSGLTECELYEVCLRLLRKGHSADAISRDLRKEQKHRNINRERIYPLVRDAVEAGLVQLVPPVEWGLKERLKQKLGPEAEVKVLDVRANGHVDGRDVAMQLAQETAEKILGLIDELRKKKRDKVHIGIGAGRTSELVCVALAQKLRSRSETDLPGLVFHAVNTGYDPSKSWTNPVSFFGYFTALGWESLKFVSFYCHTRVRVENYEMTKAHEDLKEAYEAARDFDITFTSFATSKDLHSQFKKLSELDKGETVEDLKRKKWVGDVQLCPFNKSGPVTIERGYRAVTIFEIPDFARMAQTPDKHVILIAGPCNYCGQSKAAALRPLLEVPALRVFNHLVIDSKTAREVLDA